jgi:hypothetical protein
MKNARAVSRRAQFQLWIFSYTINRPPSKKWLSRLMIENPICRFAPKKVASRNPGASAIQPPD